MLTILGALILALSSAFAHAQASHPLLDSLNRELSKVQSDTARTRIYLQMATFAWQHAFNEEAMHYAKSALDGAVKSNNELLQANAYRILGIVYTNKGKYDKAISHYQLAQSIYVSLPKIDTLNLARTLNNIGLLYSYQGYVFISLEYFHNALQLRRAIGDNIGISNSITNIGRIRSNIRDYDSARYYFRQAYEIRRRENDLYATTASLTDIGESHRKSGNSDSALHYYWKAYELASSNHVNYNASFALSAISNIYSDRRQYDDALRYAIASNSLAIGTSNWQHVRSLNSLAQAYIGLRRLKDAKKTLEQAKRIGDISQTRMELLTTYLLFYKLDSVAGNYNSALKWLNMHWNLKDSINTANSVNQSIELKYIQELKDKQEAQVQLSKEQERKKTEAETQKSARQATIVIIASLIMIIGSLIYVSLKTRRKNDQLAERQATIEKINKDLSASSRAYRQKAKELEETVTLLRKSNEDLTELNREKDGLMGVMAHDLKTPLDGIKGLTEVIQMQQNLDDHQLECLRLIELSVERGTSLIGDILFLNAHEGRYNPPKFEQVNLQEIIEPSLQLHMNRAAKKQIDFEWQTDADTQVITDPRWILRIIDNLVSNAIKFTFTGHKVQFYAGVQQERLIIKVTDQGQGIPIDEQKLLFTKFKRLSASPTGNESSTGLGLAIVKQLVEELQGDIRVESAKGVGSTFTVYLPLQPLQAV